MTGSRDTPISHSSFRLLCFPSRSSLATARGLDPSTYLRDLPTNDVGNAAKVAVSFAQLVAATPFLLVVRRSNNLRSFFGGLNMVNLSGPKVSHLLLSCLRSETEMKGWDCEVALVGGNQVEL